MTGVSQLNSKNLSQILIFGSGRWAKEYLKILSELEIPNLKIFIHTLNPLSTTHEWLRENPLKKNIFFVSDLKSLERETIDACFVVNSPQDHFEMSKYAISRKIPVLIEKPVATLFHEIQHLIKLAKQSNVPIATSQIFNFTDYIKKTKNILKNIKGIQSIDVFWEDPLQEIRYGEIKTSDLKISPSQDFLPHIFSILRYLCLKEIKSYEILSKKHTSDSSNLSLELNINNIACNIYLDKESLRRKRYFKFKGENGETLLDFSDDRAEIKQEIDRITDNFVFHLKEGALKAMIIEFLSSSNQGIMNEDLDLLETTINYKILSNITQS